MQCTPGNKLDRHFGLQHQDRDKTCLIFHASHQQHNLAFILDNCKCRKGAKMRAVSTTGTHPEYMFPADADVQSLATINPFVGCDDFVQNLCSHLKVHQEWGMPVRQHRFNATALSRPSN